jgi:hypothetical protein
MRLIPRHRHNRQREKAPRIAISQAEITADLHYPVSPRPSHRDPDLARRGAVR